jgi:hypothetical protein
MTFLLTLCASLALAQAEAPKTVAGKPTVEAVKPALMERSRLVIRGTLSTEGPWEVSAKGELRETEPGKGTITLVLDVHAPAGSVFKRNPQPISANVDLPALKDKKQGRYPLTVESPSGEKLLEGVWRDGTVYYGVFQEPK